MGAGGGGYEGGGGIWNESEGGEGRCGLDMLIELASGRLQISTRLLSLLSSISA